jgi:hypothetical protein
MATESPCSCVVEIGETAGLVWKVLSENGPVSVKKLEKIVGQPHDMVMQALGWLAREDKICIEEKGRTRNISLR